MCLCPIHQHTNPKTWDTEQCVEKVSIPVTPALGIQRQEDCHMYKCSQRYKVSINLIYGVRLCLTKHESHDRIRTGKTINFTSSFITHVHYLHSTFPYLLHLAFLVILCPHVHLFTYIHLLLPRVHAWKTAYIFFVSDIVWPHLILYIPCPSIFLQF